MNAKNPNKFRKAWEAHITELRSLAFQARISLEEWEETQSRLMGWIDKAPGGNWEDCQLLEAFDADTALIQSQGAFI